MNELATHRTTPHHTLALAVHRLLATVRLLEVLMPTLVILIAGETPDVVPQRTKGATDHVPLLDTSLRARRQTVSVASFNRFASAFHAALPSFNPTFLFFSASTRISRSTFFASIMRWVLSFL
eukprot:TRINITY_DN16785_c0_g1_i1.p2 TRINITY_DN16785_c0_g1~~TRINITY_DN16785_c0_g1_i1.p2  ORF type:complete len:123 (-),score=11.74 TRINITY_DN16785_c0_g1_i1:737-1105(-)